MIDRAGSAPGPSRWAMVALAIVVLLVPATGHAGPPYVTDDPEPVESGHWELYLATQHSITRTAASGTAPHVEVNYGAFPGLQLHIIAPLAYAHPNGGPTSYGVGDIELGAKFRFIDENPWMPMVGTFPMFELPVGAASKGLGTWHLHVIIPLWLQKSFGPWTTYGGGGYWRNPGQGNRDFWYIGWLMQLRLGERAALGSEVFYTTPATPPLTRLVARPTCASTSGWFSTSPSATMCCSRPVEALWAIPFSRVMRPTS